MKKCICNLVILSLCLGLTSTFCQAQDLKNVKHITSGGNPDGKMPLVITASKYNNPEAPALFFISGDGGWYKFEQSIADKLSNLGIPTIGLDTKKYFWHRRTPEETASDVEASLGYYSGEWGRKKLVLAGYSLGAEILPFIITRLPGEMRSRISLVVMLSPSRTTDFEVHITDMLGMENKHNTYKVVDEIIRNNSIPSLCIFGSEEKTQVPAMLKDSNVKIAIIPGDHHYNSDASIIISTMKNHGAF
jgi:type IV secretory pathway VirJ component